LETPSWVPAHPWSVVVVVCRQHNNPVHAKTLRPHPPAATWTEESMTKVGGLDSRNTLTPLRAPVSSPGCRGVVYTPSLRVQALQPPTSTKPVGPAQCNLHDPHPAPRVGVHSPPGLPASRCLSLTDREPLCGTKPMASLLRRARGGSDAAVGAQPAHGMSSLHPHPLVAPRT
jgi:hypothetical protein